MQWQGIFPNYKATDMPKAFALNTAVVIATVLMTQYIRRVIIDFDVFNHISTSLSLVAVAAYASCLVAYFVVGYGGGMLVPGS